MCRLKRDGIQLNSTCLLKHSSYASAGLTLSTAFSILHFQAATLARLHEEIARHKSRKVDQICSNETLNQKILDTLSGREKKPEDDSAKMSTEIDENDVLNSDEKDDEKEDVDVEKLLREVGSVQIGSPKFFFAAIR